MKIFAELNGSKTLESGHCIGVSVFSKLFLNLAAKNYVFTEN